MSAETFVARLDRATRAQEGERVRRLGDGDRVAGGLIGAGRHREVDRGDRSPCADHKRVGADATVDRDLGATIGDRVVAEAT